MATTRYDLTDQQWTRITLPGECATLWMLSTDRVMIDHTTEEGAATVPTSSVNITVDKGYPLFRDRCTRVSADKETDTYYAIALDPNASISVDV